MDLGTELEVWVFLQATSARRFVRHNSTKSEVQIFYMCRVCVCVRWSAAVLAGFVVCW